MQYYFLPLPFTLLFLCGSCSRGRRGGRGGSFVRSHQSRESIKMRDCGRKEWKCAQTRGRSAYTVGEEKRIWVFFSFGYSTVAKILLAFHIRKTDFFYKAICQFAVSAHGDFDFYSFFCLPSFPLFHCS